MNSSDINNYLNFFNSLHDVMNHPLNSILLNSPTEPIINPENYNDLPFIKEIIYMYEEVRKINCEFDEKRKILYKYDIFKEDGKIPLTDEIKDNFALFYDRVKAIMLKVEDFNIALTLLFNVGFPTIDLSIVTKQNILNMKEKLQKYMQETNNDEKGVLEFIELSYAKEAIKLNNIYTILNKIFKY
ncbi:MAG: hypothetical protein QXP59_03880 [Saccharolobus sp.]